jgi:hypothetical protein
MAISIEEKRQVQMRLLAVSRQWWEAHCPTGWDIRQHLDNPAVNTTTDSETAMAKAVASAIEIGLI